MKKICNELQPGFKRPANVWTERNSSVINAAECWTDRASLFDFQHYIPKKNEPHNKKKVFLSFFNADSRRSGQSGLPRGILWQISQNVRQLNNNYLTVT